MKPFIWKIWKLILKNSRVAKRHLYTKHCLHEPVNDQTLEENWIDYQFSKDIEIMAKQFENHDYSCLFWSKKFGNSNRSQRLSHIKENHSYFENWLHKVHCEKWDILFSK